MGGSDTAPESHQRHGVSGGPSYGKFLAMIATSAIVMFILTYTNSMQVFGHAHFSEERAYMALLMGGAMAIVMLGFMWSMYPDRRRNLAILVGGLALMLVALWLSRSQTFVDDQAYIRGMIPHHSIAILTSERSDIDDVRVRELANQIIKAQRKEIEEMEWLIDDIAANGPATSEAEASERPVSPSSRVRSTRLAIRARSSRRSRSEHQEPRHPPEGAAATAPSGTTAHTLVP